MGKYKWELVIILLSLFVIVYCLFNLKQKYEDNIWNLQSALLEEQLKVVDIKDIQAYSLDSEGITLSDSIKRNIPKDVCILRLHDGICLSCYAENIQKFEAETHYFKNIRLFVLGSYNFISQLKTELKSMNIDNISFLNLPSSYILPADSIGRPYVFLLNENGRVNNLYFFQKNEFSSINKYLKAVERINISARNKMVKK